MAAKLKNLVIQAGPGHLIEFGVSAHGGPFVDVVTEGVSIGTPVLRSDFAAMRKWLEAFFAVGCEKHGAEGCIECENRCQWCGDDGDMTQRKGDRVCENCAFQFDAGDIE